MKPYTKSQQQIINELEKKENRTSRKTLNKSKVKKPEPKSCLTFYSISHRDEFEESLQTKKIKEGTLQKISQDIRKRSLPKNILGKKLTKQQAEDIENMIRERRLNKIRKTLAMIKLFGAPFTRPNYYPDLP